MFLKVGNPRLFITVISEFFSEVLLIKFTRHEDGVFAGKLRQEQDTIK